MATARSLTGLDWIVRTYSPQLLTVCNQPGKAATLAGAQPITNTTRLNAAIVALDSMEAQMKVDYPGATWDAAWSQALEYVIAQVDAQTPIPRLEMFADTDQTVKQAVKTTMRFDELTATKFVAEGGVLP